LRPARGLPAPATAAVIALALAFAGLGASAESLVRRSATGEPQTLDPQLWTYGQDGNIAQDLFQGLTTLDPRADVVPGQAESWAISPDGRT
jgi:oligopeptide transport system substrate-binding protein